MHDPFGHLKHKLWPKEKLIIKLAIWLPTAKSWNRPDFVLPSPIPELQHAPLPLKCYKLENVSCLLVLPLFFTSYSHLNPSRSLGARKKWFLKKKILVQPKRRILVGYQWIPYNNHHLPIWTHVPIMVWKSYSWIRNEWFKWLVSKWVRKFHKCVVLNLNLIIIGIIVFYVK